MRRLIRTQPHKLSLLHEELLAAGVAVLHLSGDGESFTLTLPDLAAEVLALPVIEAHDPTQLSAGELQEQQAGTARQAVIDRLQQLKNALDNWPTLTAAQKDEVLRQNTIVTLQMARFLFRRFG